MSKRIHHYPAHLTRDHARPRAAPAPTAEAVEARLAELVAPATYALAEHYRALGLRWRVLTLPVMAALVLALIWRQVPSASTLVALLAREPLLWAPPRRVSQQALSLRLRTLPAELFAALLEAVLPQLHARAAARSRPLPPRLARARDLYARVWAVDVTTLEALFRRVGLLREAPAPPLGGRVAALLDAATKLPVRLWWEPDAAANEKTFLDRVLPTLEPGTLLLLDRGFYAFWLFDRLTEQGVAFVTRQRHGAAAPRLERTLAQHATLRDRVVRLGQRNNRCEQPVRLVEVLAAGRWHGYLTNELDPSRLAAADVVALYGQRWRIEEAFLTAKRLLGLAYLWTGAANGIQLQLWATWLLYAVLVDLSDAVASELDLPLERISLEMTFRGLYFFCAAHARGEATDPIAYLAAQPDLGIVKRRRKYRERAALDTHPPNPNL